MQGHIVFDPPAVETLEQLYEDLKPGEFHKEGLVVMRRPSDVHPVVRAKVRNVADREAAVMR